jgi:DNA-binding winged helix-turn-helix (wHTH) protein
LQEPAPEAYLLVPGLSAPGAAMSSSRLRIGDLVLLPAEQKLLRAGVEVRLDPKSWRIFEVFVARAGQIVAKDDLLAEAWPDTVVSEAALTTALKRLRTALGDDARSPRYIETIHRRGFRFIAAVEPESSPASGSSSHTIRGRDDELARLAAARLAADEGLCQVFLVTGEMGIGKSTLIDTFADSLPPAWRILRCQCVEQYGSREPYMPLLEAVEELVASGTDPDVLSVLRRHAPTLLAQMPWVLDKEEAETLQALALAGTGQRMLREAASALEALADRGLLLVVEDLHWSDPATLDLLAAIARRRTACCGRWKPGVGAPPCRWNRSPSSRSRRSWNSACPRTRSPKSWRRHSTTAPTAIRCSSTPFSTT